MNIMGSSDPCPVPVKGTSMSRYFHNMGHSLLSYRPPDHPAVTSHTQLDDDTNPLFISAVRIFLEYVREKHGVTSPEKCSLDQLILYLGEFQETAKTKKGERYSPSTIRVIRYSLNRVIALGKSQQEMRPYPAQNAAGRKRKKNDESRSSLTSVVPSAAGVGPRSDDVHFVRQSPPRLFGCLPYTTANTERESFPGCESLPMPQPHQPQFGKSIPVNEVTSGKQADLEIFRRWLVKQRTQPTFESFAPSKLNDYLMMFFRSNAENMATDHELRELLVRFRAAISSCLHKNGVDFEADRNYELARDAYRISMRSSGSLKQESPKRQKKPETSQPVSKALHVGTEWLEIPTEFIKSLYRTGTLSCSNAVALQRKVWFELTIFFRNVPCCPDQMFWTKNTFKVAMGEHNVKYIELNPDMYSRYGSAMERRGQDGRIMVERKGSPLCPVASFELYTSCLDPDSDCLFPPALPDLPNSNGKLVLRKTVLYAKKSLSNEILSEMMATIAHAGRIPFRFSNLSAAATDHLAWLRAVTAVELELSCAADFPSSPASSPEEAVSPFVRNTFLNGRGAEAGVCSPRQSVIQSARKFSQMSSSVSDTTFSTSPRSSSPLASDRSTCSSHERDNRPNQTEKVWNKKTKLLRYVKEAKDDDDVVVDKSLQNSENTSADCIRELLGEWCTDNDLKYMLEHNPSELDLLIHNNLVRRIGEGQFKDRNDINRLSSGLSSLFTSAGIGDRDDKSARWPVRTSALLHSLQRNESHLVETKKIDNHMKSQMTVKTEPIDIWMVPSETSHSSFVTDTLRANASPNSPPHSAHVHQSGPGSDIVVIVRPQISIVHSGLADIAYQTAFDRRIKAEVEKAIRNVDWDAAVDHAIQTAKYHLNRPVQPANGIRDHAHQSESHPIKTLPKLEQQRARKEVMIESEEFMGHLSKEMMEEVYQDICCGSPVGARKAEQRPISSRPAKLVRRRSSSLSASHSRSLALETR